MWTLNSTRLLTVLLAVVSALLVAVLVLLLIEEHQPVQLPEATGEYQYWRVTLEELGVQSVSVPVSDEINHSQDIEITLPDDAQQGPDDWWILFTSFSIVIDPDSGPGFAWVRAGTNGRISNQVSIESRKEGEGFLVSRVEMLNGPSRYLTLSPAHTHYVANYMQDRGVSPGKNKLRFSLQLSGDIRVNELTFHGNSEIIRIPLGPPNLEFEPIVEEGAFRKGEETLVEVDVHSTGWPVKNLVMRVDYANDALAFRDPSARRVSRISGGDIIPYHITPLSAGQHELVFRAEGANLGPLEGTLTADIGEPAMPTWPWEIVGGLYLSAGGLLYIAVRQTVNKRVDMLSMVRTWRDFARENRVKASLLGGIPFAFLSLLLHFFHYNVYGQATPGTLMVAMTILYLALAVLFGFTTPIRAGSIGPVLAYPVFVLLWPLLPGQSYESITYDSGWIGGILFKVLIPSGIIWLFVYTGYSFGHSAIKD